MPLHIPIPDFLSHLPVDSRGYPIPFFAPKPGGVPMFKMLDQQKQLLCIEKSICPICGKRLKDTYSYVITGPVGHANRVVTDPPMHRNCAEFTLAACPHMYYRRAERKEGEHVLDPGKPDELRLIAIKPNIKTMKGPYGTLIKFKPVRYDRYIYVNNKLTKDESNQIN